MGSVETDGTFSIPLKEDYLTQVKMHMEENNKGSSADWRSSLTRLNQAFGCSSGSLEIENGDQPVTGISTMGMFALGSMEEEKLYGYVIATSSDAFAKSIMNLMNYQFEPGYFVDWHYVEEAATIKGSCSLESYTLNQEELYGITQEYDLEFKPGWNVVQYEVREVFRDRDGKTYPSNERYSTLDKPPSDMKYVFIPDSR
jgi:hypothetical protein